MSLARHVSNLFTQSNIQACCTSVLKPVPELRWCSCSAEHIGVPTSRMFSPALRKDNFGFPKMESTGANNHH